MATVRIELDDGRGVYVTAMPVNGLTSWDVLDAFHEAASLFMRSIIRDQREVHAGLEREFFFGPGHGLRDFIATNTPPEDVQ